MHELLVYRRGSVEKNVISEEILSVLREAKKRLLLNQHCSISSAWSLQLTRMLPKNVHIPSRSTRIIDCIVRHEREAFFTAHKTLKTLCARLPTSPTYAKPSILRAHFPFAFCILKNSYCFHFSSEILLKYCKIILHTIKISLLFMLPFVSSP